MRPEKEADMSGSVEFTTRKGETIKQTGTGYWRDLSDGSSIFVIVTLLKEERWDEATKRWQLLWRR